MKQYDEGFLCRWRHCDICNSEGLGPIEHEKHGDESLLAEAREAERLAARVKRDADLLWAATEDRNNSDEVNAALEAAEAYDAARARVDELEKK